jgi:hypothetical protein
VLSATTDIGSQSNLKKKLFTLPDCDEVRYDVIEQFQRVAATCVCGTMADLDKTSHRDTTGKGLYHVQF